MIKTEKLISEVISLPTDIRTLLVSKLLESLNPSVREIDELWATEAEQRVDDVKKGKVKCARPNSDRIDSQIKAV